MANHWSQVDESRLIFVSIKNYMYIVDNNTRDICTLVHIIDQGKLGPQQPMKQILLLRLLILLEWSTTSKGLGK